MCDPEPRSSLKQGRTLFSDREEDLSKGQEEEQGPRFHAETATRSGCIAAVSVGAIFALLCFISGIFIIGTNEATLGSRCFISASGQEVLTLAINVVLTFCIDGMMFAHSVSLRWTLYHEERLEYNTNVRLFTSSKKPGPNSWYINVMALFCLVLSYGSSSILLVYDEAPLSDKMADATGPPPPLINATALVALGLGLGGQAAIAVWCLVSGNKSIPTWSSNPLNTTLAAMQNAGIVHQPGRCMLSVHQRRQPSNREIHPVDRQRNILHLQRTVRYVLAILWTLALLAITWPIVIAILSRSSNNSNATNRSPDHGGKLLPLWRFTFNWNLSLGRYLNFVTLSFSPSANTHDSNAGTFSYGAEAVTCLLFVCLLQASQTIGLHCVELLVNLSRDESAWRQAYSGANKKAPGAQLSTNAFRAALSSWENVFLFIAKALLHWVIGQSLLPSIAQENNGYSGPKFKEGFQIDMVYSRLIIYAILAILLAAFATYLASKRPRGCQPATFGHLQTLADLVDDWKSDQNGRLWWGDKTSLLEADKHVRHAGTSWDQTTLEPICTGARYAGKRYQL